MPGLKGVTNFFVDPFRTGVPLICIGVEKPEPEADTAPENKVSRMPSCGPLVGVEAVGLKRDNLCCGFPEFLEADGLTTGDLKGFVEGFLSMPEANGV